MKPRVLVFGKHPQPGKVKTRLAMALGTNPAMTVYRALVQDLLEIVMPLTPHADIEIHLDTHSDFFAQFPVPVRLQEGRDLGERIQNALSGALDEGVPAVALLGSDPVGLRTEAIRGLLSTPGDLVFGPAGDGGYWSILARRTHPAMFEGVTWSTSDTLETSMRAAIQCGLSVSVAERFEDLDTLDDLLVVRESWRSGTLTIGDHLASALIALEDQIVAAAARQ